MKLQIIIFLIFIFIFQIVYSYGQEGSTFSDPKGRYKIFLPSNWKEYTENGESIFTAFEGEKSFATCYIFGFPVDNGMTVDDMSNWMLNGLQQGGDGCQFKIISKSKVKVSGVDAILIRQQEQYKEPDFEETVLIDEYFFIKNGQGIILHFDTSKDSYDKFQGAFKKIADSFSLGKESFAPIMDEGFPKGNQHK